MQKYLHDINCVFQGLNGVGAIYVSGITGAKNITVLQKYNIKAVVCAARSGYLEYDKSIIQDYLYIPADDYEQFDLSQYFQKADEFIEKNRKKTNVLVHCMAGISRSATLVIAYLIKKYNYSMDSILSLLKRKRSIINPNQGFLQQLKSFQNKHQSGENRNQFKRTTTKSILRETYFSINKTSTDFNRNQSTQGRARKALSKQSRQFLQAFRKKQNPSQSANSLTPLFSPSRNSKRRTSSNVQDIARVSANQNRKSIKFLKPEFYSSELGLNFNIVHVQKQFYKLEQNLERLNNKDNEKEVQKLICLETRELKHQTHIQEQKLQNDNQMEVLKQNITQKMGDIKITDTAKDTAKDKSTKDKQKQTKTQKTQLSPKQALILKKLQGSQNQIVAPLSERLQILKANLLSQYKKNKQKANPNFSIQNEEQKQINLALATKILKTTKPRRYADKKTQAIQ